MNTIIIILMVLVLFNLVLKQTFNSLKYVVLFSLIVLLFIGLSCPFVIEQSKEMVRSKLGNYGFVLDLSVVLCLDILIYIAFCFNYAKKNNEQNKRKIFIRKLLYYCPSFLFFIACFFSLSLIIYFFPGKSFYVISWTYAVIIAVAIPLLRKLLILVLPYEDMRLELLFSSNIIMLILSVLITVVNSESIIGTSQIDINSLLFIIILSIVFTILGVVLYNLKIKKIRNRL